MPTEVPSCPSFLVPLPRPRRPRHLQVVRAARRARPRDVTIGPRSRIGVVAPNGTGKSTLLRILAGIDRPDAGPRDAHAADRARRLPAPGTRAPRRARPCAAYLGAPHRRRATPSARSRSRARRSRDGERRRRRRVRRTRSTRYLALGAADFDARVGAGRAPTSACRNGCSISTCTRSRAARPARATLAAILLARFDVFLLDEPTNDLDFAGLDRLERFLRADLAGGAVIVSPRPGVPRPHDHERARARRARAQRVGVRRRLGGVPRRARDRAPRTPRRSTRRTSTQRRDAAQPRAAAAAVVGAGQGQGREERRDRQVHPPLPPQQQRARRGQGQDHRPGARAARANAVEKPWESWDLRMEIAAAPRSGAVVARLAGAVVRPRDVHARPGRPRDRLRRAGRDPRQQRQRQDHAARRRARADPARRRRRPSRARAWSSASSTRPAPRSPAPSRCSPRFERASGLRAERGALAARQVRARRRARAARRPTRCRRASAPGRRSRCSRRAGVNCLVLDEPTNHLDLPAIEQLEQALRTFAGTLLLVTHDRAAARRGHPHPPRRARRRTRDAARSACSA